MRVPERGQAIALVAVGLGLLCACALATAMLALQVAARARLQQAASAAALGVVQEAQVRLRLAVRYRDERCARTAGQLACRARPGSTQVTVGPGAFRLVAGSGLGPLPGWAAAAGCVGTSEPTEPGGAWRICVGQRLVAAALMLPADAAGRAQQWLLANLAGSNLLGDPEVVRVTLGPGAAVAVIARARLRPGWGGTDRMTVRALAWPAVA